tara:strand:- start:396 stop:539 length:144 start_codon:yes stop_codon:yes gene_type:complete
MDFAAKKEELIKKGTELSDKVNELNLEIIKIKGKIEMCDEELNSGEE